MRKTKRVRRLAAVGVAMAVLLAGTSGSAGGQTAPPPDDTEDLQPALQAAESRDPSSPLVVLPSLVDELGRLATQRPPSSDAGRPGRLRQAVRSAQQALVEYTDGSTDLAAMINELAQAARRVEPVGRADDAGVPRLAAIGASLAEVARKQGEGVIILAASAGVDRQTVDAARAKLAEGDSLAAAGSYGGAAEAYGEGLSIASGGLHFDLDRFEAGVRAMAPLVVGFAYTINTGGSKARSDASGDARTDADSPRTAHSPDTEQFLASVSKTITGVAMLRALQDRGISVDSPIEPYLPPAWPKGQNLTMLTFRHLFNHKSSFVTDQGTIYTQLRARIAQPFPTLPVDSPYSNANFALMRILLPRVVASPTELGVLNKADANPGFPEAAASLYAESFEKYVRNTIFAPIGIDGGCRAATSSPDTRYYNWPADNQPGYVQPGKLLECGGYGWFLSANELAAFMAHLRYTNTLISPATRKLMDTQFLGWMDPVRWPNLTTGTFGVYQGHGGDWTHGPGDAHTCIMKFPINVEVAVVMNSKVGFAPLHQCELLADAYDAAWVA